MKALVLALLGGVVSYAAAFWILRKYFKRSVFFQIGLYWVFTLVWIMFTLSIRSALFGTQLIPYLVVLGVNVGMCLLVFYIAARKVA